MSDNDKPVYENPWLEAMRMMLAFIVKMKWVLVIVVAIFLAWKLGLDPITILEWLGNILGTAIGAG